MSSVYHLRMRDRWRKSALVAQSVLLVYFQVCMWLPLGGWNGVQHFPVQSLKTAPFPIAVGFGTALLIIATLLRIRWLMWIGVVGHLAWFSAQGATLWPPYIFGASPQYAAMYSRAWGTTTRLLPNWGNHLAPNAMHLFIQALLVAVLVTTVSSILSIRKAKTAMHTSSAAAGR